MYFLSCPYGLRFSLYLLWLGYFFCCNGNYDLISLKKNSCWNSLPRLKRQLGNEGLGGGGAGVSMMQVTFLFKKIT